ncbi:MAG TPA: hypothetical protein EYP40_10735 [Chromatiales bacterium]|nr:hypothetical protein [Chromatiales bacterium]
MTELGVNPYQPHEAVILDRIQESPNLFTLRLKFTDQTLQDAYEFEPGQFNMLYLYGVGEIPVSIVSDPVDSHIIEQRRQQFGRLNIVQGVKHTADFIWKERYDKWRALPETRVLLAADAGEPIWPWHIGLVTDLFDQLEFEPENTVVMTRGPEGMMRVVCDHMLDFRVPAAQIFLSMERNMQCTVGHCGHCQYGSRFVCKDGLVFSFDRVRDLFGVRGF